MCEEKKRKKNGAAAAAGKWPSNYLFLIFFPWLFFTHFSCLELLRGILDCIDKIEYIFFLGYTILRGDPCYFRACWYQTCAPIRTRSIIIKRFFSIIENIRFRKMFYFFFVFFLFDEGEMMERTKSSSFQRTAREN